jgi:hypothetical protein
MAKETKKTADVITDVKTARKIQFTEGELRRKKNKSLKTCPYRIVRVWDAEKLKYVKKKVYRKKTTLTKDELKARFKPKAITIVKKAEHPVHNKTVQMRPKVTHCYIGMAKQQRLDWDKEKLCYKAAA